jgi:hypothetical protein
MRTRNTIMVALVGGLALGACGADQKEPAEPGDGPRENAGEEVDEAAEDTADAAEEAGEEAEGAAEETADETEDALD